LEAIILAGGRGERLGDAAAGRPKPLVEVAGRSLISYQVRILARAGVERVVVSCSAGAELLFEAELSDLGPEIVCAPEPRPLGRGGGLRYATGYLAGDGPVYALNGDELMDIDLEALLRVHTDHAAAATITVARMPAAFGVVELTDDGHVSSFKEAPFLPHWVNSGIYVLGPEAVARLPHEGDHETSTFPELASEGKLLAYRHPGVWLTVNTPKELRKADEFLREGSNQFFSSLAAGGTAREEKN
jgi:NDP-sugar pyrophosphorylase family protein